jgi:hypothetical protein
MDFHKTCYRNVLNKGQYMKTCTRSHACFEHSFLKTCGNEKFSKNKKKSLENNLTIYTCTHTHTHTHTHTYT